MSMSSGTRPFIYDFQPYPIKVPSDWNINGLFHPTGVSIPIYENTMLVNAHTLGQAWFSAISEYRSLPSGHPCFNYDGHDCRGIIYIGSGGMSVDSITPNIYEPSPSGSEWISLPGQYSGIAAQIQTDAASYYIKDLRNMHNNIFEALAADQVGVTANDIKKEYLKSMFPVYGGDYRTVSPTGFHTIDWAEVQYNPFPQIAGVPADYLDEDDLLWGFFAGKGSVQGKNYDALGKEDMNVVLNSWRYFSEFKVPDRGGQKILGLQFFTGLITTIRSSPFSDQGDYVPGSYEVMNTFGVLDSFGHVFPACQTIDGQLTTGNNHVDDWWADGGALGKSPGVYTTENQGDFRYNDWTDTYNYPVYDTTFLSKTSEFVVHYVFGGASGPSTAFSESADKYWHRDLYPIHFGYDPSDFLIGYAAWYKQDDPDSVRVDGHGMTPGTRFRIIDLKDRSEDGWESCRDYIYYASNNTIAQSGSREVHSSVDSRNVNYGVHWGRYPGTIFGFPSYSGEPVRYIDQGIEPESVGVSGVSAIKDRRVWFSMPNMSNYSIDRSEEEFNLITPIFAERRNVKKICVEHDATYSNGILSSGVGASGQYSIWPSNVEFQNGSGIGYHIMDKGIWVRKSAHAAGLQLISPYNGQRLLFKKAEDTETRFGEAEGLWRKEVRGGGMYHFPEHFYGVNEWRRTKYFLNPFLDNFCQDPGSKEDPATYLQEFRGNRSYVSSWYRSSEEQAPHTDGTYTIFNISAESPESESMSRADYLGKGDRADITFVPIQWYDRDSTEHDSSLLGSHVNMMTYPIATGWFSAEYGAGGDGYIGGYAAAPGIPFVIPITKYTPTLDHADHHGSFTATRYTSNNFNVHDPSLANLSADIDIYIARKPYCQWDIPGLEIQRYGEARVNIGYDFLKNLLYEGLRPGYSLVQQSLFWAEELDEEDLPTGIFILVGNSTHEVAFNGFVVLKLEMYGLQESSKGGRIEGWGKFVETGSAGITEEIDPSKEWTQYEVPPPTGYDDVQRMWWHQGNRLGWESAPSFRPASTAFNGYNTGSRFFRVWFDPKDPSEINCVDDIFDARRYGLIVNDKLWRYQICDKNGSILFDLRSTKEGLNFMDGDDFYDYKTARKGIVSITWVENEMIAAADIYKTEHEWRSFYNNGRAFELATLSQDGVFDNDRANMIINEPGRQWTKQRPGIWDPSPFAFDATWTYEDPYQHRHYGYDLWNGAPRGFYDDLGDNAYGEPVYLYANAIISAYSSEVSDLWPKIVYANIK